ncbi:MAG: heme-binding protein [Bacteroidota bacterium]|nr:heme-binding protein [Bacteroidota bacterium]
MADGNIEIQKYSILKSFGEFEIRKYNKAIFATTVIPASTYENVGNSGFRNLANYIFGGNKSNQKISMTAPVHMNIKDSVSYMSFVMPSKFQKSELPEPNSSMVQLQEVEEETVAAIRFSGYASDSDIKKYTKKLKEALDNQSIKYYGDFRFLGYNAPYQILFRRNEIIVNVDWK